MTSSSGWSWGPFWWCRCKPGRVTTRAVRTCIVVIRRLAGVRCIRARKIRVGGARVASLKTGSKRGTNDERGADLYETPYQATRALLASEGLLPKVIWEPACGPGAIARELRLFGHVVMATDLHDYHSKDQDLAGVDFLLPKEMAPAVCTAGNIGIVTNPPYKHAQQFVERALEHASRVYMLLRLAFLESVRRNGILDGGHLARVWVFRDRLPMMHRAGWEGPKASSAMAFAWFVWDTRHQGPPTLHRVSWRDYDEDRRDVVSDAAA